jgi:hypothetical protein
MKAMVSCDKKPAPLSGFATRGAAAAGCGSDEDEDEAMSAAPWSGAGFGGAETARCTAAAPPRRAAAVVLPQRAATAPPAERAGVR